ncbi:MAG: hypothetical protein JWN70_4055 [Planctomycetaceae bacterium]|nr:hypothetical protein [Planctomycetaceae bacterium]
MRTVDRRSPNLLFALLTQIQESGLPNLAAIEKWAIIQRSGAGASGELSDLQTFPGPASPLRSRR